jgi:transposase
MSVTSEKFKEELLNIEIAIELDSGKSIPEIAEKFAVKLAVVKAVAKKTGFTEQKITKTKNRRFSQAERGVLVERIANGEAFEDIAAEAGITASTLRRWCKQLEVTVPRRIEQISLAEQREIRELLEEQDWREIAFAYNISLDVIEELKEPEHRQLNTETLSYLFELLRERPRASSKILCGIAKEAGLEIPDSAVNSYRKRLKLLGII